MWHPKNLVPLTFGTMDIWYPPCIRLPFFTVGTIVSFWYHYYVSPWIQTVGRAYRGCFWTLGVWDHGRPWCQMFLWTNVYGAKRPYGLTSIEPNICGDKRPWAHTSFWPHGRFALQTLKFWRGENRFRWGGKTTRWEEKRFGWGGEGKQPSIHPSIHKSSVMRDTCFGSSYFI